MSFCIAMASAVTTCPAMSSFPIRMGIALISLLFSWHVSLASVIPAPLEKADTMSGLRPFPCTVPHSALPSMQMMSGSPFTVSSLRKLSENLPRALAMRESSMPFSIRQNVGSDGTPFSSIPIFRRRPRLNLLNSMMSALEVWPQRRARIISVRTSHSLWRILPFAVLLKSGTEDENPSTLSRMLLSDGIWCFF